MQEAEGTVVLVGIGIGALELFYLVVVGTSIWMCIDASRIGYQKEDVKGLAGMGPFGWLVTGLLLWIVAFPLYLASRNKLVEAAERRQGAGPKNARGQESAVDVTAALAKLGELRSSGVLTDAEFEAKKSELLARL